MFGAVVKIEQVLTQLPLKSFQRSHSPANAMRHRPICVRHTARSCNSPCKRVERYVERYVGFGNYRENGSSGRTRINQT